MKTTHLPLAFAVALAALGITLGLRGQNKDPFVKDQSAAAPAGADAAKAGRAAAPGPLKTMVGLLLEYVRVDHLDAVRLVREHGGSLDSTRLRSELESMIEAKQADLLDTVYMAGPSNQRVRRQSILEMIYPTEYGPPEIARTMMLTSKEGGVKAPLPNDAVSGVKTAATPTAFETRNIGVSLEAEFTVAPDRKSISLLVGPEMVSFHGWRYYMDQESPYEESKDIRMPIFRTMRTRASITMKDGEYALIGCFTPPDAKGKRVLALLRADVLK